jgi:hypothetical protein
MCCVRASVLVWYVETGARIAEVPQRQENPKFWRKKGSRAQGEDAPG